MLKKTITYEDYNGKERTEDFYFHMTKPKIMTLEYSVPGGLSNFIDRALKRGDEKDVLDLINILIVNTYGVKSDDGRRFIQNDEVATEFMESPAYEKFIFDVLDSVENAEAFIQGVMPSDVAAAVAEAKKEEAKKAESKATKKSK